MPQPYKCPSRATVGSGNRSETSQDSMDPKTHTNRSTSGLDFLPSMGRAPGAKYVRPGAQLWRCSGYSGSISPCCLRTDLGQGVGAAERLDQESGSGLQAGSPTSSAGKWVRLPEPRDLSGAIVRSRRSRGEGSRTVVSGSGWDPILHPPLASYVISRRLPN